MKKLLFTLLILPFLAQAQFTKTDSIKSAPRRANFTKYKTHRLYSYSAGIKLFSYEELPAILNQVDETKFQKEYLTGFILKINDNQISYRISGNFYSDNISFANECEECEAAKGKVNDNAIRFGFEKNFVYADIQPYFGFDVGYRRNSFEGTVTTLDTVNYKNSYNAVTHKNGLSISPLLGIKFNIASHFTIAAESSLDLLYSYEKQERTYKSGVMPPRSAVNYSKWEFLLRPVGLLSLQYNFSEQY